MGKMQMHDPGPPNREHRVRQGVSTRSFALALAGWISSVLALVIGLWRWSYAYMRFGPVVVWRLSVPWVAAGIVLALLGVVFLAGWIHDRGLVVQVHRNGMIIRRGSRVVTLPWSHVESIRVRAIKYGMGRYSWASSSSMVLTTKGGRRLRLSDRLTEFGALVDATKRHVYPLLMEELRASFNQGDPLPFGPLMLTSIGVHSGKRLFPWPGIEEVALGEGHLVLLGNNGKQAAQLRVPAHQVPNVDLCVQLIQLLGQTS